jgi:hypothetical protein
MSSVRHFAKVKLIDFRKLIFYWIKQRWLKHFCCVRGATKEYKHYQDEHQDSEYFPKKPEYLVQKVSK